VCPEKTIREEVINDALVSHLEAAQLSDEAVQRLREKILGKPTLASTSILMKNKAAISEIKQMKERLLNAYLSGRVAEQVYESKHEDLTLQENALQRDANLSVPLERKQQFAEKFLEHVKSLVSTYLLANQSEKRQLIELLFSNIKVTNRKPLFATQNWLQEASIVGCVPNGGPKGTTHRSRHCKDDLDAHDFLEAVNCPDAEKFCSLCDQIKARAPDGRLPGTQCANLFREAA
jgi:hypothetical protein